MTSTGSPHRAERPSPARVRVLQTRLGALTLVGEAGHEPGAEILCGVYHDGHRPAPDRTGWGSPSPAAFAAVAGELEEYLAGERRAFDCPWRLCGGGPLRRRVWEEIAAIPYGQTCTYAQLAAATGTHPRAVGGAVAHNPLSIIVPCHRVVGSDRALTGYAGGLERKRALLTLEGALAPTLAL